MLQLKYLIIDSKKWQHHFFGKDTSQIDLKKESEKLSLNIITNLLEGISDDTHIADLSKIIIKHRRW